MSKLKTLLGLLIEGNPLPENYLDHPNLGMDCMTNAHRNGSILKISLPSTPSVRPLCWWEATKAAQTSARLAPQHAEPADRLERERL